MHALMSAVRGPVIHVTRENYKCFIFGRMTMVDGISCFGSYNEMDYLCAECDCRLACIDDFEEMFDGW